MGLGLGLGFTVRVRGELTTGVGGPRGGRTQTRKLTMTLPALKVTISTSPGRDALQAWPAPPPPLPTPSAWPLVSSAGWDTHTPSIAEERAAAKSSWRVRNSSGPMLSVRLVTSTYRSATTPRMVENGG